MRTTALWVLVTASTAAAAPASDRAETVEIAAAINAPFMWTDGASVGVSGYVGFAKHHALRANFATHAAGLSQGVGTLVGDLFFGGDGSDAFISGRTTDVGASYQYYTRTLFSGPFLEGGVMRRTFAETVEDDNMSPGVQETNGRAYAARAQVGWSWAIGSHAFIAAAAGISAGRYSGRDTSQADTWDSMSAKTSQPFDETRVAGEAYLRIGGRFGL